jgi:hypothetical protein
MHLLIAIEKAKKQKAREERNEEIRAARAGATKVTPEKA